MVSGSTRSIESSILIACSLHDMVWYGRWSVEEHSGAEAIRLASWLAAQLLANVVLFNHTVLLLPNSLARSHPSPSCMRRKSNMADGRNTAAQKKKSVVQRLHDVRCRIEMYCSSLNHVSFANSYTNTLLSASLPHSLGVY